MAENRWRVELQKAPGIHLSASLVPGLQYMTLCPCFMVDLCGYWGLNSGPNASMANTSVAERSPHPLEYLHSLWKGKEMQATLAIGQRVG